MPTSNEHVQAYLDEHSVRYHFDEESDATVVGFLLDEKKTTYRDLEGKARIQVVIKVLERGGFVIVFAPQAWAIGDCPHKGAVLEALIAVQSQYKMIRFDHDPDDGEVRPNVELPLDGAELSTQQLHRMIHGIIHCVQQYDCVIRHAMTTGETSFSHIREDDPIGTPPSERSRLERLVDEAGGLDAFERLVSGVELDVPPADADDGCDSRDEPEIGGERRAG
jgi:hypothetical protein